MHSCRSIPRVNPYSTPYGIKPQFRDDAKRKIIMTCQRPPKTAAGRLPSSGLVPCLRQLMPNRRVSIRPDAQRTRGGWQPDPGHQGLIP
jgi:hypothetical protein